MGAYEHFPYTNYQDVNIDWVLKTTKRVEEIADDLDKQISDTVDAKLQEMIDDGTMSDIINDQLLSDINDTVDGLQNDLGTIMPLDATPTDGSTKGVTSDGVYDAIDAVQNDIDAITPLDAAPTNGSTKGITSGAVYTALENWHPEKLSNKKLLLFGDSYNYGTGGVWGKGWGYYVEQYTGATCDIVHQNNGGFTCPGNSNATYPNKTYVQAVGELDPDAGYDIIVVQCGPNDINTNLNPGGAADIATAETSFIAAIKAVYPDAELIILPTWTDIYPANEVTVRFLQMCKTAVSNNVRTCFDSFLWMQNSGYAYNDGAHLTDSGYQLLASYIVAYLLGWSGDIIFQKNISNEVTVLTPTGVTVQNFKAYVDKTCCHVATNIILDDTISSWTQIVTGVPSPKNSTYITCSQWGASFTRNMRAGASWGSHALVVQYGAAGTYQMTFTYPINLESD